MNVLADHLTRRESRSGQLLVSRFGLFIEGVFAMYSWPEGIYHEIGDGQIDAWCHEIAGAVNGNWKKNFV